MRKRHSSSDDLTLRGKCLLNVQRLSDRTDSTRDTNRFSKASQVELSNKNIQAFQCGRIPRRDTENPASAGFLIGAIGQHAPTGYYSVHADPESVSTLAIS